MKNFINVLSILVAVGKKNPSDSLVAQALTSLQPSSPLIFHYLLFSKLNKGQHWAPLRDDVLWWLGSRKVDKLRDWSKLIAVNQISFIPKTGWSLSVLSYIPQSLAHLGCCHSASVLGISALGRAAALSWLIHSKECGDNSWEFDFCSSRKVLRPFI